MKNYFLFIILCISFYIFGLRPSRIYYYTPDSMGLAYESVQIMTSDTVMLQAWKMSPSPKDDKKTTIIIAGGDAGNMSNYVYHAHALVMKGYTVLTFDYRGFGESAAFNINEKFLYYNEFATDLEAVIKWSQENIENQKTGLWAFSMGSICTAMALQKINVDFVIAEGFVFNPIIIAIRLKLIDNKDVYNPEGAEKIEAYIKSIPCKMLVFAGALDQITTLNDSKKICQKSKLRKLIKFKGNHLQGMEYLTKKTYGDEYIALIDEFI